MSNSSKVKKPVELDEFETDLEKNFDEAKPLPAKEKAKHLAAIKQAADSYIKKDKRINIRVYGADLEQIRRIALQEGLPYQTLITSILHKFATGQLSQNRTKWG